MSGPQKTAIVTGASQGIGAEAIAELKSSKILPASVELTSASNI